MAPVAQEPWQRLDPRMLLVHPVVEVVKFLPVLIGLLIAGGVSGTGPWSLLGVAIPVTLGVVRYLSTTYRISSGRVELRRGLLDRHSLAVPVDRVRTVDLSASPVHRILGLATVVVGTGSVGGDADERLELDALPRDQAAALRGRLLAQLPRPTGPTGIGTAPQAPPDAHQPEQVLARFSPRWLWFAPFSSTGFVALGALIGAGSQFIDDIEIRISDDTFARVDAALIAGLLGAALLLTAVLTVGGYLVTNGGFVLSRYGATWHVRRGLLTRRETSIDVARLAGVRVGESAALRLARGRRLDAIVTGLAADRPGAAALIPPAPRQVVERAAIAVLGEASTLEAPLRSHGRTATVRRYTRALLGSLVVVLPVLGGVLLGGPAWLLVLAVVAVVVALGLATDRARALGHGFLAGHVVMRSGSVLRHRDALAAQHVIGWTLRATWFQRRAGLLTLTATTAGGSGRVMVDDVPSSAALVLAEEATPGLLAQFRRGDPVTEQASERPSEAGQSQTESDYAPQRNGEPDPGEVVWAWVPYEDDPNQGKDRPVLVIGLDAADDGTRLVRCLVMTSKDHDRDAAQEAAAGRYWMDVGTGAWDSKGRPSEVRLNRLLVLAESDVRREGAALDADIYAQVLAERARFSA